MSQESRKIDVQSSGYGGTSTAVKRQRLAADHRQGVVSGHRWVPTYVWFMLPGLILYVMFFIGPMFDAFRLSFYDWPGVGTTMHFVGLRNFANAFTDPEVYAALWHNFQFFIIIFILQNTVGLGLALLLNVRLRGYQIHRTLLYLPSILSLIVTGFIWELMLHPQIGLANPLLQSLGLGGLQRAWLGDPSITLIVVILVQAWQWMGLPMVVYLAGLQSIPRELLEAAMIDGANKRQVLARITFPLLAAPFTILTIFCFIAMFRVFDIVYVLGGPLGEPDGSTTTLGTVILEDAFGGLGGSGAAGAMPQMSYAMAIGVLSYILLGAVAGGIMLLLRRREIAFG
jgi:raffinose/stachyose/melibiose transport system permease protein